MRKSVAINLAAMTAFMVACEQPDDKVSLARSQYNSYKECVADWSDDDCEQQNGRVYSPYWNYATGTVYHLNGNQSTRTKTQLRRSHGKIGYYTGSRWQLNNSTPYTSSKAATLQSRNPSFASSGRSSFGGRSGGFGGRSGGFGG